MFAITAGYMSITALNSFIHIIVSIYFRQELTVTGIANLPSASWIFVITLLQFVFGLFGGLLATTLARKKSHIIILGFILLMAAVALIDYSMLNEREPLWYLVTAPTLKILGIFTGFRLIQIQNEKNISMKKP